MSSDYSPSSSRKSTGRNAGDKSYDEEFEKFLNDMTESEVSKKPSALNTPWWMKEDDDVIEPQNSRSFMKKPKPEIKDEDDDIPRLSLDNSTLSTNRDVDLRPRQSDIQEEDENYEEDFSDPGSSSRKSSKSVVERKSSENVFDEKADDEHDQKKSHPEPNSTNLLSKVMFMDSLEGANTGTHKPTATNNDVNPYHKKETTHRLNDTQNDRLTTQTRNDLQDLAIVYQNLAGEDSGFKGTLSSDNKSSTLNNQNYDYYDLVSSRELRSKPAQSVESDFDSRLGHDVIQAVTDEIENHIASEVLKEIERKPEFRNQLESSKVVPKARQIRKSELTSKKTSMKQQENTETANKPKEWPPKKYQNAKGTGYGSTWVPPTVKRTSIVDGLSSKRSSRSLSRIHLNQSLESSRSMADLEDQLIRCVDENEKRLNEVRKAHERQVTELRSKISDLSTQLREKNERMWSSERDQQLASGDKKQLIEMERRLKEQDQLLKGYQIENEKLYADLRHAKEAAARDIKNLEEEKKGLRVGLIQEKLAVTRSTSPPRATSPNVEARSHNENEALRRENMEIRKRLEFYEKHQHQIEEDVKEIESKREEIKKLKEKIKTLESGRTAPEYVRELKRTRNQLKEMELLVKRLRKNADPNTGANLSLDYYEKRIEALERQLKEKTLDFDRYKRMWEEKYQLLSELGVQGDFSGIESRLLGIESGFKKRVENLEAVNSDLRDAKLKLEVKLAEKHKELVDLKHDFDNYVKRDIFTDTKSRSYRPDAFLEDQKDSSVDFDYVRRLIDEMEKVKIKLVTTENELRLRAKEHEYELDKVKTGWQQRLADANRKHKTEIEKLLNLFTGKERGEFMSNFEDDYETSVFDDPIQARLLKRASERFNSFNSLNESKLSQLIEVNNRLNAELVGLRERCRYLEEMSSSSVSEPVSDNKLKSLVNLYEKQLKAKNKEIDRFRSELDVMLKVLQSLERN